MRSNPKCQDCLFFDGPDRFVDLYPVEGQCRRNAPQALLLPITNKSKPDDEGSTETPNTWFAADWPIVSGDDWCGEFRIVATPDELRRHIRLSDGTVAFFLNETNMNKNTEGR